MKLTKTTLKQIIKEEAQKVLKERSSEELFDQWRSDEVDDLYGEAEEDDELEIRDDSQEAPFGARLGGAKKQLRIAKKVLARLRKRLTKEQEEYKKIEGSLRVTWNKQKEEGKIPDYMDEYEKFSEWRESWRYGGEKLTKAWRKKKKEAAEEVTNTKKMMKMVVAKAKEEMADIAKYKAEDEAAKQKEKTQKDAKPTTWVGKSRQEVLKALQDEFKIKPTRNWYKKLPMRHPARVKFREWYKASRGK
tara:strand:- start:8129 stop:8869 length:741 start_codon:yes stop_codon:yes gene_type:complete